MRQSPASSRSPLPALVLAVTLAASLSQPAASAAADGRILAQGAESYGPVTPTATSALRELPHSEAWKPGDPIREVPRRQYPLPGSETLPFGEGLRDPLLDLARGPDAPSLVVDVNVAGTGFTGATPPDTVGDVGPSHYVQAVNASQIAIFDKSGSLLAGYPIALESLAPVGHTCRSGSGDPIVLYDDLADRWFLQEFTGGGVLCIYVSQTSDPTGAYYFYSFTPPSFPDYPHYGVWPDAYYATTNENGSGGSQTTYAFDRVKMLAGQPATMQRLTAVPPLSGYDFQTLTPADLDGDTAPPAGAPGLFVRHRDDEAHDASPAPATDLLELYAMAVDFVTPANTTLTALTPVAITDYNSWMINYSTFYSVPQPGSSTRLDAIREAVLNRLVYRNFGGHETLLGALATNRDPATSGSVVQQGVRWFELRRTGGPANPWVLHQEGTFGGDTNSPTANFFMGSVAMDGAGNIALGYSKTDTASPVVYPSLGLAGRLAGDPPGSLGPETPLVAGVQSQGGTGRWGDYAAMSIDPADDCTFWYTNEYMPGGSWGTRVASFVFQECLVGFLLESTPGAMAVCAATDPDPVFALAITSMGGWSNTVTLTATGLPPATTSNFSVNGQLPDFTSNFTIVGTDGSASGTYPVEITGTGGDLPATLRTRQVTLELAMTTPAAPALLSPGTGVTGVSLLPTFTWAAAAEAATYDLEVATDVGFASIVASATGLTTTSHTLTAPLADSTLHYWRVTAHNVCGQAIATPRPFTTVVLVCTTFPSTDVPKAIPDNASVTSTLAIPAGGVIADVNVLNLVGTHTFMGDIDFTLTSPDATAVVILARSCSSADNFNLNLDDEAAPGAWPCPPVGGGTYQPSNPLSAFDGEESTGTWSLTVADHAGQDTGQLQSWSLRLCIEVSGAIFSDGFESGSTAAWSEAEP